MKSDRQACFCGSGIRFRVCHGDGSRSNVVKTLDDTRFIVRPVFASVDDSRYPLIFKGSCFVVVFRGDAWIVTADHVVQQLRVTPDRVRVPVELTAGRRLHFFDTRSVLWPEDRDREDTAWLDLNMIRIERGQRPFAFVDLDKEEVAPLETATFDDAVRVHGYPASLDSGIDYERQHVALESFGVDGAYWGLTSSRFLHAAIFTHFGKVRSLDGMSGGPVFFAKHGATRFHFAGVVVRGSVESKRIHFIDARVLIKTLTWHYDEDPNRPTPR